KQIDRQENKPQQEASRAEKSADTCLQNVPQFSKQSRERLLQLWHLFFHVRLNALTFGAAQLWLARGDLSSGRNVRRCACTCLCLSVRRGRWTRPDQQVGETFGGGSRLSFAEEAECLVEPKVHIDDVMPSAFSVGGDLPCEVCALNGDRRNEPCRQPAQGEKGNGEEQRDCLGATKRSARHFCDERIEQIAKNHGDGHRDQDWLKETDHTGSGPDDGSKNHHENNDEARSQRRPHHFALPEGRVFLHLSISNNNVPNVRSQLD